MTVTVADSEVLAMSSVWERVAPPQVLQSAHALRKVLERDPPEISHLT